MQAKQLIMWIRKKLLKFLANNLVKFSKKKINVLYIILWSYDNTRISPNHIIYSDIIIMIIIIQVFNHISG